jgi:hypothetical protein
LSYNSDFTKVIFFVFNLVFSLDFFTITDLVTGDLTGATPPLPSPVVIKSVIIIIATHDWPGYIGYRGAIAIAGHARGARGAGCLGLSFFAVLFFSHLPSASPCVYHKGPS